MFNELGVAVIRLVAMVGGVISTLLCLFATANPILETVVLDVIVIGTAFAMGGYLCAMATSVWVREHVLDADADADSSRAKGE